MSGAVDRDIETLRCAGFFCEDRACAGALEGCEEAADVGRGGNEAGTKSRAVASKFLVSLPPNARPGGGAGGVATAT
jgi:hypothetical protein